jgi:hypothetical protein
VLAVAASRALPGCSSSHDEIQAAAPPPAASSAGPAVVVPRVAVEIAEVDTRCEVASHMRASLEMQLSGEPLAEAMGRDLAAYQRFARTPDRYAPGTPEERLDLAGFSAAVESYEYSKLSMNMLAFESAAGVSLAFGPLTNAKDELGAFAQLRLRNELQFYATQSDATERYVTLTDPLDPYNPLGWPGMWPVLHPFRAIDPTIAPTATFERRCSLVSDDTPAALGLLLSPDYECDATSLRLPDRASQTEPIIGPGASGWLGWKQALWAGNYLGSMHDRAGNTIVAVDEASVPLVGKHQNQVVGLLDDGTEGAPGTYVGSSELEGFQAALLLRSLDNQAEHWLRELTTVDGTSLSGFADLLAASRYDRAAPLRWLPSAISVAEQPAPPWFPRPSYAVASADSDLLDLLGLVGAYAQLFSITDPASPDGGAQAARVYFDGVPFPADDASVEGEATPHDRSLAMLRFLLVTLDRTHLTPSGLLADRAAFDGVAPRPGASISIEAAAYAIVVLRVARLSLTHRLGLYGSVTPDTAGLATALDAAPLGGGGPATVGALLDTLIQTHARVLRDGLTDEQGRAAPSWDLAAGAPASPGLTDDRLDAHAAAVRGLYAAYLATGDATYRERAEAVFARLDAVFFDPAMALYTERPAPASEVTYTPARFALVQAALREHLQLSASRPGHEGEASLVEARLARLDKLVLNGWDDRDDDGEVDWPTECAQVVGGLPRGGLQMAERTLTGELGSEEASVDAASATLTADRDHDCVPEIDDARLHATLAGSVRFVARPR